MFSFIKDREQEIALLKFAKLEAQCNLHNIEEAKKLDPILKKDGSIHKTNMKKRETIIKSWEKENKKLQKFFKEHKIKGEDNDYKRYSFRSYVTGNRHLENIG